MEKIIPEEKISIGKLKSIAIDPNCNPTISFGPYQISKSELVDLYIKLFKKELNDSDSVILHTDFKEGTFHAGNYKIYGDVYGGIFVELVKKDNCEC